MLTGRRTEIIGGMFGLADLSGQGRSFPPFVTRQTLFLASARSGIALLLKRLAPGRLWLPSFYCNHLLKTLQQCGVPVSLYGIGADLQPVSLDWTAEVEPGDLVIMVDYFGFPCSLNGSDWSLISNLQVTELSYAPQAEAYDPYAATPCPIPCVRPRQDATTALARVTFDAWINGQFYRTRAPVQFELSQVAGAWRIDRNPNPPPACNP